MKYKFFCIPIYGGEEEVSLNQFLSNHRVLEIDKKIVDINGNAMWSFCVKYIGDTQAWTSNKQKEKIDYKNKLSEEQFDVFSKLRAIRKVFATEEGLPAYAIFTDEELSLIASLESITEKNVGEISGIGVKKKERYASRILQALFNEKKG